MTGMLMKCLYFRISGIHQWFLVELHGFLPHCCKFSDHMCEALPGSRLILEMHQLFSVLPFSLLIGLMFACRSFRLCWLSASLWPSFGFVSCNPLVALPPSLPPSLFFSLSMTYFLPVCIITAPHSLSFCCVTLLISALHRSSTRSSTCLVRLWTLPVTPPATSWTSVQSTTVGSRIRRASPRWPTSTYKYVYACQPVYVTLQDLLHCYGQWCHSHQHVASPSSRSKHGNPGLKHSATRTRQKL